MVINDNCDDLNFLVTANDTSERQLSGKVLDRGMLKPMLDAFERMPDDLDFLDAIRGAHRNGAIRTSLAKLAKRKRVAKGNSVAKEPQQKHVKTEGHHGGRRW